MPGRPEEAAVQTYALIPRGARPASLAAAVAAGLLLALAAPAAGAAESGARAAPRTVAAFSLEERKRLTAIVRKAMAELRQPGVNVGIWIPGRGSWVRSFGVSNRRTGAPMRTRDHVRIASITKTFTAVAVLRLVDQGRLGLDDALERYVPGIPNGRAITVRDLLAMSSGIYDFTMDEQFARAFEANPLLPWSLDDVIEVVQRHEPAFAPGAQVEYCDTNYEFLGAIVEQVTGRPVEEVIRTEILEPLGLNETSFPTTPALPRPFARGYYAGENGRGPLRDYTATNPDVAWAGGAMVSTLADLRVWARVLATGRLLTPATHAEQLRIGSIPNPGGVAVGYGLGIFELAGFLGHNGAIFGYSTAMFYLPEAKATIVVEGNQSSNSSTPTTTIFFRLAEYLFPERFA